MDKPPDWAEVFPYLADPRTPADRAIAAQLSEVGLEAGQVVFHQGDPCRHYLLLVEGSVRVVARASSGREVLLYRLGPGSSCVLTTSCLLGQDRYPAEGVAETAVRALALPAAVFQQGLDESAAFRRFVFENYARRLVDVIAVVETLASGGLEGRLARWLAAAPGPQVAVTHQRLAAELGTAREVVSRHLKALEREGLIAQGRGRIEILDRAALARRAAPR